MSGGGPRHLAALVVTQDRLPKLRRAIERLRAARPDSILVVANASPPDTLGWLDAQPDVDVLALPRNTGGAGGFEAGMRRLFEAGTADWIVVMDDDAGPEPDAFDRFRVADLAGVDAVAGAVMLPSGAVCDMNRPAWDPFRHSGMMRETFRRGREAFHMGEAALAPSASARAVDVASFVGLFLSRGALARHGYPDPRMFLYGDDTLYTLRATKAGMRLMAMPSIRFEHDCEAIAAGDGRLRPIWKVYYNHRNLLEVYAHTAGPWAFAFVPAAVVKWLVKARRYRGERGAYLALTARAIRDYLGGSYARAPHARGALRD